MIDLLIDANGDPVIEDGDFKAGESTLQHQEHLLTLEKGEDHGQPLIGVGIGSFLLDDGDGTELKSIVQQEFEADGMRIGKLTVKGVELSVEAEYG